MIALCEQIASLYISDWESVYIVTEMINVRLDITSLDDFQNAICNVNFLDMELLRESLNKTGEG